MKTTDGFQVVAQPQRRSAAMVQAIIEASEQGRAVKLEGEATSRALIQGTIRLVLRNRGWVVHTKAEGADLFLWATRLEETPERFRNPKLFT